MAATREIKRRTKTAKNIGQVTRAMEMVSAVKMKRAQDAAISGRPYITELEKMIRAISAQKDQKAENPLLFLPKKINKVVILVVAPKKGLCGPLVTNLSRTVAKLLESQSAEISFVTFEKKSRDIIRYFKKPLLAEFANTGKQPTFRTIRPIAEYLLKLFRDHETDLVLVAYTNFVNTVSQKAVVRQLLPLTPPPETEIVSNKALLFEPSTDLVLDSLLVHYCEAMLYQIILESSASEHSARMVAMKNAHENAADIVSELTLFYNKVRQNSITNELADTISGSYA